MDRKTKLAIGCVASFITACTAVLGVDDVPNVTQASRIADAGADTGDDLASGINAWAAAICAKYQSCQPSDFDFNYASTAECVASKTMRIAYESVLPGIGTDAAIYRGCATQEAALSCDDFASATAATICAVKGTKALGEKCLDNDQCASGFCGSDNATCRGCINPPQSGDACAAGDQCDVGLVCASEKCVHEATLGAACNSTTQPCIGTLACVNGSCVTLPAALGAACSSTLACNTSKGFVCDVTTNQCITYTVSSPGGPCSTTSTEQSACRLAAACTNGTCGAAPAAGQACDETNGPYCPETLNCVNSLCTAFAPLSFCN